MATTPRFNAEDILQSAFHTRNEQPKRNTPPPPRFTLSEEALTRLLKKTPAENSPTKMPQPAISPAIERRLNNVLPELARRIEARLEIESLEPPSGNAEADLQHVVEYCIKLDGLLEDAYDELMGWHVLVQRANIYLDVGPVDLSKQLPTDRPPRSKKRSEAALAWFEQKLESDFSNRIEAMADVRESVAAGLVTKLDLPTYSSLGGPLLTREIMNSNTTNQLFEIAKHRSRQKCGKVAGAFLQGFRNGLESGLYFELHVEQRSQSFRYSHFHIGDAHSTHATLQDTAQRARSMETPDNSPDHADSGASQRDGIAVGQGIVRRIESEQTLVLSKAYDLESTLKNPMLEIPFSYRRVLEKAPSILHDLLIGLFGTQVIEQHTERKVSEFYIPPDFRTQFPDIWRQRWNHMDPCIAMCGIAVFGWGGSAMNMYREHQDVVNKQRKLLDDVAALRAKAATFLTCGLVIAVVMGLQTALLARATTLLVALIPAAPALTCALAFLAFAPMFLGRMKLKKIAAAKQTAKALERLQQKYPGFDPSLPRLAEPEKK